MSGGDLGSIGSYLQQMNDSGALQGLANMGSTMANAGAPGLGYKGLGAGLASGAAAFGPGMLQGAEQNYQEQQLLQARAQAQQFQGAFGTGQDGQLSPQAMALRNMVPEQMRPIMYALGPTEGAKMLSSLAMNQMDPTRGKIKLAPGEAVYNEITHKMEYQTPFSPRESTIETQGGTVQIGPDGQLHMISPKPPEITPVGPYAVKRNFQTGDTSFIAPPGSEGEGVTPGTPGVGGGAGGAGAGGGGGVSMTNLILAAEGNGRNPTSSAAGYGGFTDPTAKEFMQKYGAEAAQRLGNPAIAQAAQSPDGGLSFFRMNPDVQKYMTGKMADETGAMVNQALPNTQKTPADYYAGYMLRNDAPAFLKAVRTNPSAPVNTVLPAKVISSNPSLFVNSDGSMATVGQAYAQFGNRVERAFNAANAKPNPMRFTPSQLVPVQNPDGSHIYVPQENAVGLPAPSGQQTNVSVQGGSTPSASVTIGAGAPGSAGTGTGGMPLGAAGTPAKGEIGNSLKQIDLLTQAANSFDPSWLSTLGQAKMWTLGAADRLTAGKMLSADQQKQLADFTAFKQRTQTLGVEKLHELFGARLTDAEIKRQAPNMPSMTDSPTEYQTKLQKMADTARNAIMRDTWLQSHGMKLSDETSSRYDISNMPNFVKDQAVTYAKGLQDQGVPDNVAAQRTLEWLGTNFGIVPPQLEQAFRKNLQPPAKAGQPSAPVVPGGT